MKRAIQLLIVWNIVLTGGLAYFAIDTHRTFQLLGEYLQKQESDTKEAVLVLTKKVLTLVQ